LAETLPSGQGRLQTFSLIALIFALGFGAIVAQSLFLREFLVVYFGNELSFGITLGSWLIGVCLGAWVASRLADRIRKPSSVLALSSFLAGILLPLLIFFIRTLRTWTGTPIGEYLNLPATLLASLILTSPFSFFIGFSFPLAVRIAPAGREKGLWIGKVYVAEAIGSVAGGVLFSYLFIIIWSSYTVMAIAMLLYLAALSFFLLVRLKRTLASLSLLCMAGIAGLLLAGEVSRLEQFSQERRWRTFSNARLVTWTDSRYQNITIGEQMGQFEAYANGKIHSIFPDEIGYLEEAARVLVEHPSPKRVLLIGAGLGGLVRKVLSSDIERLDYVELDPRLLKVISNHLPEEEKAIWEDPRFSAYFCDGRFFVKACISAPERLSHFRFRPPGVSPRASMPFRSVRYDMLILNLGDPSTAMLNRLYTLEFFKEAKAILADDGVVALRITSSEDYISPEVANYAGCIYRTLKRVFPFVLVSPGTQNYFFASSRDGIVSTDPEVLSRRFIERGLEPEIYSNIYTYVFPDEKTRFINSTLAALQPGPLNRDFHPIAYFNYLLVWGKYSAGALGPLVKALGALRFGHLLLALSIGLSLHLLYLWLGRERPLRVVRFNNIAAIAVTGFTGLSLEIVLMFAYISLYGYLYQKVGMVVALFMFGLSIGALAMTALLERITSGETISSELLLRRLLGLLVILLLAVAGIAFLVPGMMGLISRMGSAPAGEIILMSLLSVVGFLTGAEFPLAARLHLAAKAPLGRAAGALDSADHLGAAAGGFLAGAVLVPVAGLEGASYFSGLLVVAASLPVVISFFSFKVADAKRTFNAGQSKAGA